VEDASAKEKAVSRLRLVDGVRWIVSFYGNLLVVTFYYRGEAELERRIRLISSISGAVLSRYKVPFPRCSIRLSETDWRLVRSLRKDPRKNYSSIARELGISVRTARRRIKRMTDARTLLLQTVLDLKRMKGGVLFYLTVFPAEGRRGDELQRTILSKVDKVGALRTFLTNGDLPFQIFVVFCDSVGEVNGVLKRVRAIEGVKEARADMLEERFTIDEWLDEQIERRLKATESIR
jgi:DNA-binding Lrp family transcriptional regulator